MGDNKPIIKATTPNSKKYDSKIDIYTDNPKGPHDTIHIAVDTDNKKAHIIDTTNGPTEHTDVKCYLTSACMQHYLYDFDDNCEELCILRWFRDNIVSKDDILNYYILAPIIVENINSLESSKEKRKIYNYIYNKIVKYCVNAIKNNEFEKAYSRYRSAVLTLEEQFLNNKSEISNQYIIK